MQWFRKEKVMPLSMLNVFGNRKDSIVDVQEEQLHTDAERIRRRKARHGMEKGRNVSWYWIEKLKLLVDAFQIYGLCWMMSQAWPWPTSWLRRSRFLLLFNLDIFSLTPRGASLGHGSARYSIWGEMEGYWIYATVWASLPWIATFFYILKCLLWKRHTEEYYLSHREALRFRLFYLFQILYLPIAIAVGRLWNCNADGTLSVDPVMICWGSEHSLIFFTVGVGMGGTFLVVFPLLLWRYIMKFIIYSQRDQHEQFLQSKELEYLIGTSEEYKFLHLPIHSSYKRKGVCLPVYICVYKGILWAIFTFLRSPRPDTSLDPLQGTLYFCLFFFFALYRNVKMPYRVYATNRWMVMADWTLMFNGTYVVMSAHGVRSALTVASSTTTALSVVNNVSGVYLAYLAIMNYKDWLLFSKGRTTHLEYGWPTHRYMKAVVEHMDHIEEWKNALIGAKHILEKSCMSPDEFKPTIELEEYLHRLQQCSAEATADNHLLQDQLIRATQEVAEAYTLAAATSLFPMPELEEKFSTMRGILDRRHDRRRLNSSTKQQSLDRLLALQTWVGERDIKYVRLDGESEESSGAEGGADKTMLGTNAHNNSFNNLSKFVATSKTLQAAARWHTKQKNAYSPDFLQRLEWSPTKLYHATDVEDWNEVQWFVSIYDDRHKVWVTVTAIEYSTTERILKVKVPHPMHVDDPTGTYFIGYASLEEENQVNLIKCLDEIGSPERDLFVALKTECQTSAEAQSVESTRRSEYETRQEERLRIASELQNVMKTEKSSSRASLISYKKQWKRLIRQWELDYTDQYGKEPDSTAKLELREWYEQYQHCSRESKLEEPTSL